MLAQRRSFIYIRILIQREFVYCIDVSVYRIHQLQMRRITKMVQRIARLDVRIKRKAHETIRRHSRHIPRKLDGQYRIRSAITFTCILIYSHSRFAVQYTFIRLQRFNLHIHTTEWNIILIINIDFFLLILSSSLLWLLLYNTSRVSLTVTLCALARQPAIRTAERFPLQLLEI